MGDIPIPAQYALDLIFKTLIDDEENLEYLTTMPELTEQTNSIMLEMILQKYSKKYRKYLNAQNGVWKWLTLDDMKREIKEITSNSGRTLMHYHLAVEVD